MGSLEGTFDTSLHEAVRYCDIDEVRVALRQGYDPNLIGLYQWSALHEAVSSGEIEILKCLLKHKGDPDRKDFLQGYTALHYAAKEDHIECLELLLEAGGDYNITNNNGTTCLDVAKGQCLDLLQSLRAKDLMKLSLEEAKKLTAEKKDLEDDLDLSISSSTDISIKNEDRPPALGYIHLTFEYNSKKSSMKVRVWQVTDLLLPPTNTSMIHSLYVKSYLMPDKKKDSKRKTEEVRVDSSETHDIKSKGSHLSVQHVYSPSSFKFTKPLDYDCITKEMIKERSVQIELCLTQRYSKRSFLIGMVHMKLKEAVKKMVRDKYPLIPCMNHTIPSNLKVYCASELKITNSKKVFYSNPDVRNLGDSLSDCSSVAASNPDMQVVTLDIESELSPVKLEMSQIQDYVSEESNKQKEIDKQLFSKIPGLTDLNFEQGEEVTSRGGELISRVIDITDYGDEKHVEKKSAFSSVVKSKLASKKTTTVQNIANSQQHSIEIENKLSPKYVEDWKYKSIKEPDQNTQEIKIDVPEKDSSRVREKKVKIKDDKTDGQNSRPETPTWDYYDLDLEPIDIAIQDTSPNDADTKPVYLPMDTQMSIKGERSKEKIRGHHRSGKRREKAIPGKAIPQIVITDVESSKKVNFDMSKSFDPVTPRNVMIEMDNLSCDHSRPSNSEIIVKADIHTPSTSSPRNESTTIEIKDSDSFIIDLEDIDSVTPSSSIMQTKLRKTTIPMQVFIDENYDSFDEASQEEDVHRGHPYLVSKNNDMISEV